MVLVPWGRDQPGVAARAEALGVAAVVPREDATADALRGAAVRVLGDDRMKEQADRHGARSRSADPPGVAAELIEGLW